MSIRLLSRFTLTASLGFMAAAPAFAQQQLVPAESSIHFVSRQMGVPVEGHFGKFSAQVAFDPAKPVYVEAESRRIGKIHVPDALLETMRQGECINIEAAFDARVDFLLRDYDYFLRDPDWLRSRLDSLRKLQSREAIERWLGYVDGAQWRALVAELLELHYDPLYHRSQNQNFTGLGSPARFACDDLTPAGVERLATAIRKSHPE